MKFKKGNNYLDSKLMQSKIDHCKGEIERLQWCVTELESRLHKQEKIMEKVFE